MSYRDIDDMVVSRRDITVAYAGETIRETCP